MQYLYLIKCNSIPSFYKVGIASDVESRLAQLQTGTPFELEIEECYSFKNSEVAERAIHQAWDRERVRGEWFELQGDAVSRFQDVCSMLGGQPFVPDNYETTIEAVEEAEETAANLYYFNCDSSCNHYVYTIDPNKKEPNGRKKRVYLWKFSDPRTQEYCPDEAARWLSAHVCKRVT